MSSLQSVVQPAIKALATIIASKIEKPWRSARARPTSWVWLIFSQPNPAWS